MDKDLELAIQISLEEQTQMRKSTYFPSIFECRHDCQPLKSVFSFKKQNSCYLCNASVLDANNMEHKSPIRDSTSNNRSIAIKPTIGSFATYTSNMLLHCGISDSQGLVHNFDGAGLHIEHWKECLLISIDHPFFTNAEWDKALQFHHNSEKTRASSLEKYKDLSNNCYDYIIRFFNSIQFEGKSNHTKEEIIQQFILKPINYFESFYTMFKKVQQNGLHVGNFATTIVKYFCDGCGKGDLQPNDRFKCRECEGYDLCTTCKLKNVETDKHKKTHIMENDCHS